MKWLLFLALAAAAVLFGRSAVAVALDTTTRGKRLTRSTVTGDQVNEKPVELAYAAGQLLGRSVSLEAYALARMLRSEAGSGLEAEKIAVCHVALNDARVLGWDLVKLLTFNRQRPPGYFGAQRGGRYATTRDPYEVDLRIAEAVLAGKIPDNTGGATKFVHASAFGIQPGTTTYAAVATKWAAEGYSPREVPGAGSDFTVFVRGAA